MSEDKIDELVIEHAEDDDAWEKPIFAGRKKAFSLASSQSDGIVIDQNILNGEPVFRGTRVPVSALFDNLEVGVSLDEFLENFPTVTREQAVRVLEYHNNSLEKLVIECEVDTGIPDLAAQHDHYLCGKPRKAA